MTSHDDVYEASFMFMAATLPAIERTDPEAFDTFAKRLNEKIDASEDLEGQARYVAMIEITEMVAAEAERLGLLPRPPDMKLTDLIDPPPLMN